MEAMTTCSFHRPPHLNVLGEILDSAFAVRDYLHNFPHIFLPESSASIALARDSSKKIIGMCSVDSEFWSEPVFLRGACIGSVAVHPDNQGVGVGSDLLRWVCAELHLQRRYDFVYLFSDKPSFYENLGFTRVGEESLFTLRLPCLQKYLTQDVRLQKPREISSLEQAQLVNIWQALERGRKSGESHATWSKFIDVSKIQGLLVSWLEDAHGRIVAGGFIGKGIDFQGVMHSFFADTDHRALEFLTRFSFEYPDISEHLLLAPGLWNSLLSPLLQKRQSQPLCLVQGLEKSTEEISKFFNLGLLYPRSIFSS